MVRPFFEITLLDFLVGCVLMLNEDNVSINLQKHSLIAHAIAEKKIYDCSAILK